MLTNNYKNYVNGTIRKYDSYSPRTFNLTDVNGKVLNDLQFNKTGAYFFDQGFGAHTFDYIAKNDSTALFVGTGNKEESLEDIALESIIADSDLLYSSAQAAYSVSEGKYFFTETFTYIGTSDITINEVAFYKGVQDVSGYYHIFCLARQKIEPLAVKTGDVFTVTMVIG